MLDHFWIAEIKLITASILHSLTVTHKEPAIIRLFKLRTMNAHDLDLKPQSGNHTFIADVIQHVLYSFRETFNRRQPLTNSIPPFARGVPACIDTEILTANLCRSINERQQLLCSRRSP